MKKRAQSWKTIAKEMFDEEAVYHGGKGQYALVTPCRDVHYTLWLTREDAIKWNRFQCGGGCQKGRHYIVDLSEVTASNK